MLNSISGEILETYESFYRNWKHKMTHDFITATPFFSYVSTTALCLAPGISLIKPL